MINWNTLKSWSGWRNRLEHGIFQFNIETFENNLVEIRISNKRFHYESLTHLSWLNVGIIILGFSSLRVLYRHFVPFFWWIKILTSHPWEQNLAGFAHYCTSFFVHLSSFLHLPDLVFLHYIFWNKALFQNSVYFTGRKINREFFGSSPEDKLKIVQER